MKTKMRSLASIAVLLFFLPLLVIAQERPGYDQRYPWDKRWKKCFADPKEFPDVLTLRDCRPPEWNDYRQARLNVFSLVGANPNYDLLDRASNELGFSRQKFPTGEYLFEALFYALDDAMETISRSSTGAAQRFAEEWSRAKGDDGYARLMRAVVQYHEAWQARGTGYANTVTPEGWKLFFSKLEEANATLDSSSAKLKETGAWHALKLRLVFAHPKFKNDRMKVVQDATAAWPDYLAVYSIPMAYMHPRWGGTYELMEGVAQLALQKTRTEQGAAMYALVYEDQFRADCDCTLADSKVDWPTMKQGMRDVESHYAVTPDRLKHFAGMACQMRDRDEAKRWYGAYDKLKRPDPDEAPDPCRVFASR